MADIVLVPGSFHGGWYFSPIVPALREAGHRVFPLTLTGLGERRHLSGAGINLSTHIEDVVSTFEMERVRDAVLVGHSYGGAVITGAASRLAGRLKSLVYLDALLPENGQSAWSQIIDPVRREFLAASLDGLTHVPPPGLGDRVVPHPLATYLQPIEVSPDAFEVDYKAYVISEGNEVSSFWPIYERLQALGGWDLLSVPQGHDFIAEAPGMVIDLVLKAAEFTRAPRGAGKLGAKTNNLPRAGEDPLPRG